MCTSRKGTGEGGTLLQVTNFLQGKEYVECSRLKRSRRLIYFKIGLIFSLHQATVLPFWFLLVLHTWYVETIEIFLRYSTRHANIAPMTY
jgi:hypothetical protein